MSNSTLQPEGTSFLHKAAAVAVSILSPGQAATEMRRDAFRKHEPAQVDEPSVPHIVEYRFFRLQDDGELGACFHRSTDRFHYQADMFKLMHDLPSEYHSEVIIATKYSDDEFEFMPLKALVEKITG